MPSASGLETIREMKQKAPGSLVIILTMHDDEGYLRMALSSGASGYVLKQAANNDLLSAIRVVSQGGTYLHSSHRAALFQGESGELLQKQPGEEEEGEAGVTPESQVAEDARHRSPPDEWR